MLLGIRFLLLLSFEVCKQGVLSKRGRIMASWKNLCVLQFCSI